MCFSPGRVDCGFATTVGGSAGVVGGAMLLCAPITGILSLGLTLGCAGLGVAGAVTNTTASLVNIVKRNLALNVLGRPPKQWLI